MRDSFSVLSAEEVLSDEIHGLKNASVDAFEKALDKPKADDTQVHVQSKRLSPLGRTFTGNAEPDTDATRIIPGTVTKEEREVNEELPAIDPENNYQAVICKQCVVRDMVGCDHCGIYIYGYKHQQFKIKATKIN